MKRHCCLFFLLFLILPLPPAYSAVMSSGDKEISRSSWDGGGGPGFSSGTYSISYALAQPVGISRLEAGYQSLDGGFYATGGGGGKARGGWPQGFPGRNVTDVRIGIKTSQTVLLEFSKLLLPSTLASASRVVLIRDKDGNVKSSETAVTADYTPAERKIILSSPIAGWDSNSTYLVEIGTMALDEEGLSVEPASVKFQTSLDPSVQNTVVSLYDDATRIVIAAGTLPDNGYVDISSGPAASRAAVETATAKFEKDRPFGRIHSVREVDFYDSADQKTKVSFLPGQAVLSIPYQDSDGDGVIDGAPPFARVRTAKLYSLDENSALWIRLPGSGTGFSANAVTRSMAHFSSFALGTSADDSVTEAYAYPSPFRPHGPNAGMGPNQTGTDSAGISFVNLPLPATIEIFNLRGERVWKGEENTGSGVLVWDTKTAGGGKAASGVYLYLIRSSTKSKTGKLSIVR